MWKSSDKSLSLKEKNSKLPFESIPKRKVPISFKLLYLIIILYQIISYSDISIVIFSSNEIIIELGLQETDFSIIGCASAAGRAMGALLSFFISVSFEKKKTLLFLSLLKGILFLSYLLSFHVEFIFLIISRLSFGLIQIYENFYFSNWTEENIPSNNTVLILMQLTKPFGYAFGFLLSYYLKDNFNWNQIYAIISIGVFFLSFILLIFPSSVFEIKQKISNMGKISLGINKSIPGLGNLKESIISRQQNDEDERTNNSYLMYMDDKVSRITGSSGINTTRSNGSGPSPTRIKYNKMKEMFKQPQYFFSLLAQIILLFIFSSIQYHINEFSHNCLNLTSKENVLFISITLCLISPLVGIVGNSLINGILFRNNKFKKFISIIIAIFTAAGLSIKFFFPISAKSFILTIWIVFSLCSFVIPSLLTTTLTTTYRSIKNEAFFIYSFVLNVFGNCFGIFSYGMIYKKTKNEDKYFSMKIIFLFAFVFYIIVGISSYLTWITPEKKRFRPNVSEISREGSGVRMTRTSDLIQKDADSSGEIINNNERNTIIDDEDDNNDREMKDLNEDEHRLSLNNLLMTK